MRFFRKFQTLTNFTVYLFVENKMNKNRKQNRHAHIKAMIYFKLTERMQKTVL